MSLHPAIYSQPSEVKPCDPREPYLLVGSWAEGWTTLPKMRFEISMKRIAPMVLKGPRPVIDKDEVMRSDDNSGVTTGAKADANQD